MIETGTSKCPSAPADDERVLIVQSVEEARGPGADGRERIRLVGVAEELREDRLHGDAVGVDGIQPPLRCGVLQQPETLVLVVDHGVGERGKRRIGEQPDHLGKLQRRLVSEDGVEQNEMGHPLGVVDGERDDIGPGRVVTDENGAGDAELVEHGRQFGRMVRPRTNPAVSERSERPYPRKSKATTRLGDSRGKSLS